MCDTITTQVTQHHAFPNPKTQETVELFVASYEDVTKLAGGPYDADSKPKRYSERRAVPPPRQPARPFAVTKASPAHVARAANATSEVVVKEQFKHQQNSSKALRAELNMVHTDLKTKTDEAAQLTHIVQAREREIAQLKATVAERDAKLKSSKEDLLESRLLLQEKDAALKGAYEALTLACTERAQLRQQLIEVQRELNDTREELRKWTEELAHLKSVMDSFDADDWDALAAAGAAAARAGEMEDDGTLVALQGLVDLSGDLAVNAQEDEHVYGLAIGQQRGGRDAPRSRAALRSGGNAAYW